MELVTVVLDKDEAGCIAPTNIQAICDGDAMAERDALIELLKRNINPHTDWLQVAREEAKERALIAP
ncbi:MAG: hypothetical protein DI616_15645 [Paracoccus denitrificans]|uniref:Uncharacterized protein n=1 Tax=Paracoccus denitrificans TaxID=266 RepID=A0A533I0C9_PARDE|nr:MAG: hypothetical protein DI616_15645 [Paracoccus denitrificans]